MRGRVVALLALLLMAPVQARTVEVDIGEAPIEVGEEWEHFDDTIVYSFDTIAYDADMIVNATIMAGTVDVSVSGGEGEPLYHAPLSAMGNTSADGTPINETDGTPYVFDTLLPRSSPGTWKLSLAYTNFTGQLNISIGEKLLPPREFHRNFTGVPSYFSQDHVRATSDKYTITWRTVAFDLKIATTTDSGRGNVTIDIFRLNGPLIANASFSGQAQQTFELENRPDRNLTVIVDYTEFEGRFRMEMTGVHPRTPTPTPTFDLSEEESPLPVPGATWVALLGLVAVALRRRLD